MNLFLLKDTKTKPLANIHAWPTKTGSADPLPSDWHMLVHKSTMRPSVHNKLGATVINSSHPTLVSLFWDNGWSFTGTIYGALAREGLCTASLWKLIDAVR